MRTAYLNGQWVPESELKISAWDLAVMQSASCFEMCRSFRHKHFKLPEHLDRLKRSCGLLSIPLPEDFDLLADLCTQVTQRNPLPIDQEHRLLIVVNAGAAPMYREIEGVISNSYCYVATFPLRFTVAGFSKYFTDGVHCVTSPIQQVPEECVPSRAKHRSRLHFHLAQQQAPAGTWPLLMGPGTYLAEAPGANVIAIHQGHIVPIRSNALHGISLHTVMELVGDTTYTMGGLPMDEVAHCDELWLTGTPFFCVPVITLDGKPIGDGKIGPIYKAMMEKADALVGLCIKDQIIQWDRSTVWTPDAQRLVTTQH